MASVLLARTADGSAAALKILHADVNAIPELRQRFLREGPIGAALQRPEPVPGIVRMLEAGEAEDGTAYLAMEAIEGESLFDRATREGTLPVGEVLAIAEQVLDVLVVAHARSVVHRDIKPENLHLGLDGRVRVLDFGIARVLDAVPRGIDGVPERTKTRTGVIMGTAAYMAPEQATGLVREIDARTDVFSLGATMFRLLSGRTVHGPKSNTLEVVAAATESAPPLATVAPHVPADVCAVVDRALAFLKPHRYPSAEIMRGDVRALRRGAAPPYARAVGAGRVAPGAPPEIEPTRIDPAPPSQIAATLVDRGVDPTAPGVTRADRSPGRRFGLMALAVAGVALVFGIVFGVALATCGASSDAPPSAPAH
jgi:serine/threonine-protein kinase